MKTAEQLIEELGIQDLDTFMESAEFEQLDEISKQTLGSYIKKSAMDVYAKGLERGAGSWSNKSGKKLTKRIVGIQNATNKLTKESLESLVSAVLDGDQESASAAFNQAMGEKISGRMDSIKQEIASGL